MAGNDGVRTDEVLLIGEALIDIVAPAGEQAAEHVGGSPANVALGLGRLGVPARLRTALARDDRGERIAAHVASSGAIVEAESFILDRTSTAAATIAADGGASYRFDIDWRIGDPLEHRGAGVVHVGSIAAFLDPGASDIRRALHDWHGGPRITFDPNIRPALVGEHADAVRVTEELAGLADVVKLSDEDAAWLYPGADADAVLDRLLGLGVRVAALTLGAEGARIASRTARVAIAPRRVAVRDTVGAGDTFMASLIDSLLRGALGADADSLRTAGERAAAAAAITVGRAGADLPTRAEVDAAVASGAA